MKTSLCLAVVIAVHFGLVSTGSAMMSVARVSKEEAKEMGIEVRSKPAGPHAVWIELDFEIAGKLKGFKPDRYSRIELRLGDGKRSLVTAPLQMKRPKPGRVSASFYAHRDELKGMKVMIVVGSGLMPGGGYELEMADFVGPAPVEGRRPNGAAEPAGKVSGEKAAVVTGVRKVGLADLSPDLDGAAVEMSFKVHKTIWLSGAVPKGSTRSFAIEPVLAESDPRLSVLVSGDLADAMERFGYAPPQSHDPASGRFIVAKGIIRVYPPREAESGKGPSYQFSISDLKGFRMLPGAAK